MLTIRFASTAVCQPRTHGLKRAHAAFLPKRKKVQEPFKDLVLPIICWTLDFFLLMEDWVFLVSLFHAIYDRKTTN